MKTATITEAKNGLSALIDRVRAGESVVITDRGVPVAVIEPAMQRVDVEDRIAALERRGLVRPPKDPMALDRLLQRQPVRLDRDVDVVAMVVEDREESA